MKRLFSEFWLESIQHNARAQAAARRRRRSIALFWILLAVAVVVGRHFYHTFFPL